MEFNTFNNFDHFLSVEDLKQHEKVDYSLLESLSPTILTNGQYGDNLGDSFLHLLTEDSPSLVNVATPVTPPQIISRPTKLIAPPPMPKIVQEEDDIDDDEEEEDEDDTKKVTKPLDPTRIWSEVYRNKDVVGNGEFIIKMKTRRDQPSELLPDRLYCSLKYEIQLTAEGEFVRDLPFVMARISVVDEEKFKPVKKNNKTVVKGDVESALTHPPNTTNKALIKGTLKVQFDSIISYHHDKREVCLQVSLYLNNELEQPIVTLRSVPVKIFARKPNKKKPKTCTINRAPSTVKTKRNRESPIATNTVQEDERPTKVLKTESFNEFVSRLDELEKFLLNCTDIDRKRAMGVMFSKMSEMMKILAPTNPFAVLPYDEHLPTIDDSQLDLFLN